jgi:hypothetical protein
MYVCMYGVYLCMYENIIIINSMIFPPIIVLYCYIHALNDQNT